MAATTWILIAVVFAVGVLLLGISSAMLRSNREYPPMGAASWTQLVDDSLRDADVQLRLDLVERLSIVDTEWSRGVLERAKAQERNSRVRRAIDLALPR